MLTVSNLRKTFNPGTVNEVRALRGVGLDLPEGAFLVILGGNGSGKSTLLNAVAGSFRLDAGEIQLAGQDITRWPEHRRARLIGRVFQNPFTRHRAQHVDRGKPRPGRPARPDTPARLGACPEA